MFSKILTQWGGAGERRLTGKKFDKRGKNLIPPAGTGNVNSAFAPDWWTRQQLGSHWSKHAVRVRARTEFRKRSNKTLFSRSSETALTNKV